MLMRVVGDLGRAALLLLKGRFQAHNFAFDHNRTVMFELGLLPWLVGALEAVSVAGCQEVAIAVPVHVAHLAILNTGLSDASCALVKHTVGGFGLWSRAGSYLAGSKLAL